MPAKNWRGKSHPGLIWRILFANDGPTRARLRAELERKLRLSLDSEFRVPVRDPTTGRVHQQRWRIEPDGKVREVGATAKRKPTAKKATGRRTASQPSKTSKPSRTSKSGSTQRRRQPTATQMPRQPRAEPISQRFLQNPDGTLNGSRPADPVKQLQRAEQAYLKASRRAEQLLGWYEPPG